MKHSLKIRAHGMFGATHSWSYCIRSIMHEFFKMGHDCFVTSTDGYAFAPKEMERCFNTNVTSPDIDLCYTLPKNFKQWFCPTSKLKIAIFNWESTSMPEEWLRYHSDADLICPSSSSVRDVFIRCGWPEDKLMVLPLGVDWDHYSKSEPLDIAGLNSFRFLNVSIPHHRKNIDILIDAYYSAFSANDDVSLIIKSSFDKPRNRFEIDLGQTIRSVQTRHKNKILPKIHIVTDKLNDIAKLYKASNCVISTSSFEGFGLPMLEGLAAGCQIIAPNASGQLDFLNQKNSFLVVVDKMQAGEKYQYWKPNDSATTFLPRKEEVIDAMKRVVAGEKKEVDISLKNEFSWLNSANLILKHYDNLFS